MVALSASRQPFMSTKLLLPEFHIPPLSTGQRQEQICLKRPGGSEPQTTHNSQITGDYFPQARVVGA